VTSAAPRSRSTHRPVAQQGLVAGDETFTTPSPVIVRLPPQPSAVDATLGGGERPTALEGTSDSTPLEGGCRQLEARKTGAAPETVGHVRVTALALDLPALEGRLRP